ncbi:MAG: rod shape-determining protein MreC [Gemmatimonadota bacterium]|nr:MAG: rod shape-determining protein MreC [Gemmatimonadota bacterium]
MTFAPDRFSSRRDSLAFIVCLLLSVAARVAPPAVQDTVSRAVSGTALAPFLAVQHQVELIKASRTRVTALSVLRDSALVSAFTAQALREENERLREILQLTARLPVRHVAAEVLHQSGPASGLMVVLSAGSSDGVVERAPVVVAGGLVGVVHSVTPRSSVALLWTHPDFRVSAMTLDGSAFGIVAPRRAEGPNVMMLELSGVPYQERVPIGTTIYTSGLGGARGVYPRGIPIGQIVAVGEEQEGWSRTYVVQPAVHPAAVSHVVVLIGPAIDLREAFTEPVP